MHYAPRTIAFQSELIHPLVAPNHAQLQKLHNQLFQSQQPPYTDFAVLANGAQLSNPPTRPNAISSVAFLADRIVFREEFGSLTVDEFAKRVRTITEMATGMLGIQVLTAHQVTIRTLVNPRNFKDSRAYLKDGMFGFGSEVEDFGREPQLYGLRLVFPLNEQQPNSHVLRIESFQGDTRSLFLENQSTFVPVIVGGGLDPLEEHIHDSYAFLVERALEFIGRFDIRQEA